MLIQKCVCQNPTNNQNAAHGRTVFHHQKLTNSRNPPIGVNLQKPFLLLLILGETNGMNFVWYLQLLHQYACFPAIRGARGVQRYAFACCHGILRVNLHRHARAWETKHQSAHPCHLSFISAPAYSVELTAVDSAER